MGTGTLVCGVCELRGLGICTGVEVFKFGFMVGSFFLFTLGVFLD